jgi:predicted nucleic acid-binding protein
MDVNLLIAAIWSTHTRGLNCDMAGARALLEDFLSKHSVEFVPSDLPTLKSPATRSDQVTDIYLAELASARGMKLATLDTGIKHSAVEAI